MADEDPLSENPPTQARPPYPEGADIPPEGWLPMEPYDVSDWADEDRPEPRYEGGRRSPLPDSPLNAEPPG